MPQRNNRENFSLFLMHPGGKYPLLKPAVAAQFFPAAQKAGFLKKAVIKGVAAQNFAWPVPICQIHFIALHLQRCIHVGNCYS